MSKQKEDEWYDIVPKEQKPIKVIPRKQEKIWLLAEVKGVYKTPYYAELNYPESFQNMSFFNVEPKVMLNENNGLVLPFDLTNKLNWKVGDELFADIYDEDLKQIVIGKKLEGEDAVKALDKIDEILDSAEN
ncbi:MAG: hypothetical protein WAN80_06725 [Nitrosotalea sp.]